MEQPKGWGPPEPSAPVDEALAPKPSTALAGIAATLPLFFVMVSCGLYGLATGSPSAVGYHIEEMGWVFFPILFAALFAAVALAILLFLMGRGLRIPAAIAALTAALPWIMGLGGTYLGISVMSDALVNADASSRATMMARGIAEATQSRLFGAVLSSGLFAALGLGLALASIGQRAPRRSVMGGAIALAGLPLVGVALVGGLAAEDGSMALALSTVALVLAMVLAGVGAGADAPHARSAAMSAAAPLAAGLAIAAGAVAAMAATTITIFGALAGADPVSRTSLLAHAADELGPLLFATRASLPLALLAAAAAAAWAVTRARPSAGRLAGGAALVAVALIVVGAELSVSSWVGARAEQAAPVSWASPSDFEPIPMSDRGYRSVPIRVVATPEGLFDRDGARLAPMEAAALTAPLRELVARERWGDDDADAEGPPSGPTLGLAVDARLGAEPLRALIAALYDAGWRRVVVEGIDEQTLDEEDEASLRAVFPMLGALLRGRATVEVVLGHASLEERARRDDVLFHATVGAVLVDELSTRVGASADTDARRLTGRGLSANVDGPDVFLAIGPDATAATVFGTATRVRVAEMTPWIVPGPIPGAPNEPAFVAPPAFGGLGDHGGLGLGLGSGVRPGAADVRGSLSREVIRRVIRRHLDEVRRCYEAELVERPNLEGRVMVSFIISPTGAVQSATVTDSTLSNERVESCITAAVLTWRFPAPDGGGVVGVNYPFVLTPA